MILTAYFDESGTHDESPVTIMAGMVGSADQWVRFQLALDRLKKKYRFKTFHAKKFRHQQEEFRGWPNDKYAVLSSELWELVRDGFMHGAVLTVLNSEYEAYYRNGEGPQKLRLDTCYALSFRLCLRDIVGEVLRRFGHSKHLDLTRLSVVLERGHRHSGDAQRAFLEEKKGLEGFDCDLLAGGMTLADKDKCDPLMIADFLAYTTYMRGKNWIPGLSENDGINSRREKTTLTLLGFDPGGLADYKASLVAAWHGRRRTRP